MSNKALDWAWAQPVSRRAKLVLANLADRASDRDHICFPGEEDIARRCGISPDTVQRAMRELRDLGLVAVHRRGGDGTGRHSNLIQLNLDVIALPIRRRGDGARTNPDGGKAANCGVEQSRKLQEAKPQTAVSKAANCGLHIDEPSLEPSPEPRLVRRNAEGRQVEGRGKGRDGEQPDLLAPIASDARRSGGRRVGPCATADQLDAATAAYNDAAGAMRFTRVSIPLTASRRRALAARLIDIGGGNAAWGLEQFKNALSVIPHDAFLAGTVKPKAPGQRPFRLDFQRLLSTGSRLGDVLGRLIDLWEQKGAAQPNQQGTRDGEFEKQLRQAREEEAAREAQRYAS